MATVPDIELELLLEAIYRHYHYDFRRYATASLKRRLGDAVRRFDCSSLSGLQERVLRDAELFRALLGYLTVQVSDMFRDPPFHAALRRHVVPYLRTYPSIRVWVAGCSTGEEVYSLAILLREEGLLDRSLLYATDINPDALRAAEAGVYGLDRMAQFSEAYLAAGGTGSLADYYTAGYDSAVLDKTLRANVVFADHSLTTDAVFAEVQLVTCRNVLIYFDQSLQEQALGLLRDALCHKGFLGLGAKETLRFSAHAAAFEETARVERIYQKR
ncbi:MAG TPA: CheR family methyltransferase [Candidatus Binatia bacterium]|nr:CheR family methyltransferase [Candidatus Binatia bacterium]